MGYFERNRLDVRRPKRFPYLVPTRAEPSSSRAGPGFEPQSKILQPRSLTTRPLEAMWKAENC